MAHASLLPPPPLVLLEWNETLLPRAVVNGDVARLTILDASIARMLRHLLAHPLLACYVCAREDDQGNLAQQIKVYLPRTYKLLATSRISLVFGLELPDALNRWLEFFEYPVNHLIAAGVTLGMLCANALHHTDKVALIKTIDFAPRSSCMQ
jgi:hypothetical protein